MRIQFVPAYCPHPEISDPGVKPVDLRKDPFNQPAAEEKNDAHESIDHERRFHYISTPSFFVLPSGNTGLGFSEKLIPGSLGDEPVQRTQDSSVPSSFRRVAT